MEEFEDLIPKRKKLFIFILLFISILLIGAGSYFYYFYHMTDEVIEEPIEKDTEETLIEEEKYMIDIKGEIKKPGVYLLDKNKRVIDVIKEAGGLTNDADTSVNNLSMKIKDEMVIIIYSKKQINDFIETKNKEEEKLEKCTDQIINDSCITNSDINISQDIKEEKTKNDPNKKISINSASKTELMTLTGIGESKADKIIEYRKINKFQTIEDIKKVSGIGDSIFEKIKDSITT